jgi:hypothetical protein
MLFPNVIQQDERASMNDGALCESNNCKDGIVLPNV